MSGFATVGIMKKITITEGDRMNHNPNLQSPTDPTYLELLEYTKHLAEYGEHSLAVEHPKILDQLQWQINKYLYTHKWPSTEYTSIGMPPPCPNPPCKP